jgi:hypothetical protein
MAEGELRKRLFLHIADTLKGPRREACSDARHTGLAVVSTLPPAANYRGAANRNAKCRAAVAKSREKHL